MENNLVKEFVANLLVAVAQEWSDKELEIRHDDSNLELKKDAEKNRLYYWLLSRLYNSAANSIPARPHTKIRVKGNMNCYNKVLLTQGNGDYLPYYVEGREFFEVINDVLKTFDSFERYSVFYQQVTDDCCEFSVAF